MGNPEHLKILKQGVDSWNRWRKENPNIQPDLSRENLQGNCFDGANLDGTNFKSANLSGSSIFRAHLEGTDLSQTDLQRASVNYSYACGAFIIQANLQHADFFGTALRKANMNRVDLTGANLLETDLNGAQLTGTVFNHARVGNTGFSNVDLSKTIGLETLIHRSPSTIGIDTIYLSKGKIPESFLRGCGVPEEFIQFKRLRADQFATFYSCFISHSSEDQDFAKQLYEDLQSKGVRCWFAPEDLKVGDKIRQRIDESIRIHDKLLLVLSENSIKSEWVEDECETAYDKESREQKTVLFPVKIDNEVMDTDKAWAAKLIRSRHIGDFNQWQSHNAYKKAFDRLRRDLKAKE